MNLSFKTFFISDDFLRKQQIKKYIYLFLNDIIKFDNNEVKSLDFQKKNRL